MVDPIKPSIDVDEDRRRFLASCGRFAAVTPPAMTLLLSTSMSSDAIARSGGRRTQSSYAYRKDEEEKPRRVLIVDDNKRQRELAAEELRRADFQVVEASLGEEALELMKQGDPFLALVTAIHLPGLITGWQLAERGRNLQPTLAVIYAASYDSRAHVVVKGSLFVDQEYRPNQVAMAVRAITGLRGNPGIQAASL
jgi:CheY-like chemotaxis protein